MTLRKLLIANRGEIAVRIARACRDLGIASVAVYADPDSGALHVRTADEAWSLPGTTAAETYLDAGAVLDVARRAGVDAVHPGYGFLSENAAFARAVEAAGLTWVGPGPETIELLGDKVAARDLAREVGAPLVPGTDGPVASAAEAVAFAETRGLPVVIKAAHGGGGRGMRVARDIDEVAELFEAARREATAAFGRGECFVERFLERTRHVEAQVVADTHGNVVVVGTRDCSLQRRHQKLVEEAPAPFLPDDVRSRIEESARAICAAAGYRGAGTVEYLVAPDGTVSFLEVNTRLQVEHPVTEETSGLDLVVEQLRVADGQPLSVGDAPAPRGHALELRINAEDPARGFLPSPGRVERFVAPSGPGVRVDAGVESGDTVPGQFDSMIAKLVVWGPTRDDALARARRALHEMRVDGVPTVLPFHRAVLSAPAFAAPGGAEDFAVHTQWIETELDAGPDAGPDGGLDVQALADSVTEPGVVESWVELDGRRTRLRAPAALLGGLAGAAAAPTAAAAEGSPSEDDGRVAVSAPVPGTLVRWLADDGATVADGDPVAVVEAMKMETRLVADAGGTLTRDAAAGDAVDPATPLGWITPA